MRIGNKEFLEQDIRLVQEVTTTCQALSRKELANTICETFNWKNDAGNLKVDSCLVLLNRLQTEGKISLKPLQKRIHTKKDDGELFNLKNKINITGTVDNFTPYIEFVKEKEEYKKWNDLVQRFHYLGYKKNFGLHLKYYICLEGLSDPVGCFSFVSSSTYHLKCRDFHIGWNKEQREKNLNLIINNNRFLIFPWIKVKNLGSKIFSIAIKQVPTDWKKKFNYEPVLFETYVDPTQFDGSIYKSTNWINIGQTSGNYDAKGKDKTMAQVHSPKDVYIYPVDNDYKDILQGKKKRNVLPTKGTHSALDQCIKEMALHENELDLWGKIQLKIALHCKQIDKQSMQRSKKVNALTMLLAIYRIVYSKNFESYSSVLCELLDNANIYGITLSFTETISASTFCDARKNFPANTFKHITNDIIELHEAGSNGDEYLWNGRRIFAVDGSKVNLPKKTIEDQHGRYKLPCSHAFYPQGLISSLYRLKSRIAYDYSLVNTMNEQEEAIKHLEKLRAGDVVVYDRGYLSYALLFSHKKRDIDAIFRLKKQSFKIIDHFINSDEQDIIVNIAPSKKSFSKIKKKYPFVDSYKNFKMRLMKYSIDDKEYYIGATILDREIAINDFSLAYHGRWGHEELYKSIKYHIKSLELHGKTESFIQQEIYAGFNLLTLNRIMANSIEEKFKENQEKNLQDPFQRKRKVNFKKQIDDFYRIVEPIMAGRSEIQKEVLNKSAQRSKRQSYKTRPGRAYVRKSHRHVNKWQRASIKKKSL